MKSRRIPFLLTLATVCSINANAMAQKPKLEFPAASPGCTLKQRVGLTDIEITYSRPSVKGRKVFGSMLPYGKVWRTGANQATKIVFSTPVKLNGKDIPAGTYALMTIPGKDEWTIIINKGPEQWGAYKYDEKADLVRFTVKPVELPKLVETFTIEFNDIREESSKLNLCWEKTSVPIDLTVDFSDDLLKQIHKVMSSDEPKKPYFQAAAFFYNHNHDLKEAKKWIDLAIAEREAYYIVFMKAQILEKLDDKEGALAASKRSLELAQKGDDLAYIKLNEAFQAKLK